MSTKMELPIPEGVTVALDANGSLTVSGTRGSCTKDLSIIRVRVSESVDGNVRKLIIESLSDRRDDVSVINTTKKLIQNMFRGVVSGYTYKLKVAYSHFPITVNVKGDKVMIENFYGERVARVASITSSGVKVSINGDEVVVEGPCLEAVSQTAANIEQATRVKRKDTRVFLDGVYIYEKA